MNPADTAISFPGTNLQKRGIVLQIGAPGSWDDGMVESPVVWFDDRLGKYAMVYAGYGKKDGVAVERFGYETVTAPAIGLATSPDLLQWTKHSSNPIFMSSGVDGSSDSHGTAGPFVYPPEHSGIDEYCLFYFGTTRTGYEAGRKTLNLALSPDLIDWRRFPGNPVIDIGESASAAWRSDAIWHPNVVTREGVHYLFFNASGIFRGKHEEYIGFATSRDLVHWEVHDEQCPILAGSGTEGRWDSTGRAGDPSVFRAGDNWFMAYYSWDGENSQDGLAWTTDDEFPIGWKPYAGNPVLKTGPDNSYDARHSGKPFIIRTNETHYHFYTAVDESDRREIAVATTPIN